MTGLRTAAIIFLLAILLSIGVYYLAPPVSAEISQESITYGIDNNAIINATPDALTLENGTALPLGEKNIPPLLHNITSTSLTLGGTFLQYNSANYALRLPMDITDASKYPEFNASQAIRIDQGECVHLGETIDIAGGGWFTGQLNYYGIFFDAYAQGPTDNRVTVFKYSAKDASALYIDPIFFAKYPGWWYYSNQIDYTPAAWLEPGRTPPSNDRAFFVAGDKCPVKNETKDLVRLALNQSRIEDAIKHNLTELNVKKSELGADFIISKNLTTTIDAIPSHRWTFGSGSTPGMYDVPVKGTQAFTSNETRNLPAGLYQNILVPADKNGVYDVRYDRDSQSIVSPFRSVENLSIAGLQPSMVESALLRRVSSSYAPGFTRQKIDLQEPAITLTKFDQWQDLQSNNVFSLAGYTNSNPGDTVIIRLDGSRAWTTHATYNGDMGDYRAWAVSFNISFDQLTKGDHTITLDTNNGAHMAATFYVREELAPNHQDEVFLKYIGSSPFIPPVYINTTVTVQVPGPTRYVYVNVTPAPEEVQAATDRSTWAAVTVIAEYLAGCIVLLGIIGLLAWAYSAYRRSKR